MPTYEGISIHIILISILYFCTIHSPKYLLNNKFKRELKPIKTIEVDELDSRRKIYNHAYPENDYPTRKEKIKMNEYKNKFNYRNQKGNFQ